jgi:hypothetical protein
VALRDVLFVAEDFDVSPDEAVCDASVTFDVCAFHVYAVICLCVADGGVVSNACVGADAGFALSILEIRVGFDLAGSIEMAEKLTSCGLGAQLKNTLSIKASLSSRLENKQLLNGLAPDLL